MGKALCLLAFNMCQFLWCREFKNASYFEGFFKQFNNWKRSNCISGPAQNAATMYVTWQKWLNSNNYEQSRIWVLFTMKSLTKH